MRRKLIRTAIALTVYAGLFGIAVHHHNAQSEMPAAPIPTLAPTDLGSVANEWQYEIVPIDLGAAPCHGCGYPISTVASNLEIVNGVRLASHGLEGDLLGITVIDDEPITADRQTPDPLVQKTYRPDHHQSLIRGEDCLFWFSPFLQLTLRWDYERIPSKEPHVTVTGSWHYRTYRQ